MSSTDQDIKAASSIKTGYANANEYVKDIIQDLKYKEFVPYEPTTPDTLVDVGCICNTEYTSFSFQADRFWDKGAREISIRNARKLINDLEWQEQSNLHNGTFQPKPGLVVLAKGADTYNPDMPNVGYFDDLTAGGPTTDFNTFNVSSGGTGVAIDLFGYFHPDTTGVWTFSIPASNASSGLYTYLWVGDTALYDYTAENANINSRTTAQSGQSATADFPMIRDDYIPFRIQIISKNAKISSPQNPTIFVVKPPASGGGGTPPAAIFKNPDNGWNYFVTFMKNGAVYYKNLLYFGLVKSDQDQTKFDCFFVSTTPENTKNIRQYKQNPKLQFAKVEIPTPVMTGRATINVMDGARCSLGENFVSGVKVTITRATYGMPDPMYYYTTYSTKNMPKDVSVAAYSTDTVVPASDANLPTKPETTYVQAHTATVSVPTQVPNPPTAVRQQIDVTSKLQQMVDSRGGGYKLVIDAGTNNFLNLFGNPVADTQNDPNGDPNVPKTLHIEYTYEVPENIIDDKYLFLDPKTGVIHAGAMFKNNNISNPMSMDATPSCSGDKCKSYTMFINDKCELVVNNESGSRVGHINLKKYAGQSLDLNKCLVNPLWLKDAYMVSDLKAGVTTSQINGRKIKSTDGRFKLEYENRKLYLTFCIIPYQTLGDGMRYTTTFNKSNMNNSQIYYLYRMNTRGLAGRKFLQETSKRTGDTILHYIPNTHNGILSQPSDAAKFVKTPGFPLFKDGAPAYAANYSKNTTSAKTYTECASQCLGEPDNKCEHFFFLEGKNGARCYTDTVADANPVYSSTSTDPAMTSSNLYKKPYNIVNRCSETGIDDMQPLQYLGSSPLVGSTIDYRVPPNDPTMSYYCNLDYYIQQNSTVSTNYGGKETMTTLREGLTPTYNKYAYDAKTDVLNRFPILNRATQQYTTSQDTIGAQYDTTIQKLGNYEAVARSMASPQYNYSGTDSLIPDKFQNSKETKPDASYIDGAKKDVGVMLMQQNTMYTLASITAATCLIMGVLFSGFDVSE